MNLSTAYSQNANVLPRPMVTGTEGNSYQYVSKAGGSKKNMSKIPKRGCNYYGGKSRKQKKNKGNKSRSKRKSLR